MADLCRQCSIETWGKDVKDLCALGKGKPLAPGYGWSVICEGCGPTLVDNRGVCISNKCIKEHGGGD